MNIKKTFVIILLTVIFFFLVIAALISPMFQIEEIQITGNEQLNNEQIFDLGGIGGNDENAKNVGGVGSNIFLFNSGRAKSNLYTSNYIKRVKITKRLPSTIVINIEERKVRGYVPFMNRYLYIDMDGRVIDIQPEKAKQHPVIIGLKFDSFSMGDILTVNNGYSLDYVVQISKLIDAYDLNDVMLRLDVSDKDNIHLYVNKIDVLFGTIDDAYKKVATLNEVLKQIDTNEAGTLDISDTDNNPSFKLAT